MIQPEKVTDEPEKVTDQWRTPTWLFRFMDHRWGPFDIDLAADEHNTKCREYIDRETNSLIMPWKFDGITKGFCNPPFSNPAPFINKARLNTDLGFSTSLILPVALNDQWIADVFQATEIVQIVGRIRFTRPDAPGAASLRGGIQLVYFRAGDLGQPRHSLLHRDAIKHQHEREI